MRARSPEAFPAIADPMGSPQIHYCTPSWVWRTNPIISLLVNFFYSCQYL
jgi:hypothetical protein